MIESCPFPPCASSSPNHPNVTPDELSGLDYGTYYERQVIARDQNNTPVAVSDMARFDMEAGPMPEVLGIKHGLTDVPVVWDPSTSPPVEGDGVIAPILAWKPAFDATGYAVEVYTLDEAGHRTDHAVTLAQVSDLNDLNAYLSNGDLFDPTVVGTPIPTDA